MCKHKLVLTEDGRALICVLPDCRTGGKPLMMAGGDGELGSSGLDETKLPMLDGDALDTLSQFIAMGVEANAKTKLMEGEMQKLKEENNNLQKQIDELRRILARRGFITPRHGC